MRSAADWQSEIAREVTIQVRPAAKGDIEAEVQKAADIARGFPGIVEVRPYSKQESARLLEPWLGSGLALDDLPIPRVIVLKLAPGPAPDLAGLRKLLSERVASASLDDHRGFVDRMRAMANSAVAVGILILMLVLAATVLSVTFATRGAMAANRPIVEVLHLIGAKDGFIAGQFQRHFLLLGIKGGAIGGGPAMALFALAGLAGSWLDRHRRGRSIRVAVRLVLDRLGRLCRARGANRADRGRDRRRLAPYCQPDAGIGLISAAKGGHAAAGFCAMIPPGTIRNAGYRTATGHQDAAASSRAPRAFLPWSVSSRIAGRLILQLPVVHLADPEPGSRPRPPGPTASWC